MFVESEITTGCVQIVLQLIGKHRYNNHRDDNI